MSRETNLWKWLSKILKDPDWKNNVDLNRLENLVGSGMGDVEGQVFLSPEIHGQVWLELKMASRPVRKTTKVRPVVRDAQVEWLYKRWCLLGNAYILLQVGSGAKLVRYLIPGCYAQRLQDGMLEEDIEKVSVINSRNRIMSQADVLLACLSGHQHA